MSKKRQSISTWRRILWHLNRSPAAPIFKAVRRMLMRDQILRRRRLAETLVVSPLQVDLSQQLNLQGFAVVTDAIDPQSLQALSEATSALQTRASQRPVKQESDHKDFWVRLLDEEKVDGALPADNPFAAFALQPAVLGILARTYGELPRLDYVLLTLSQDTGKPLAFSQLWHRDHDDTRVIKLFAYLTEVQSLDDGPFTFITGPASDRLGFTLRSHRDDGLVKGKVSAEQIKSMVAPKLSVFMVETSRCLHMGSRLAPGHERLLYTATFISVPRLFPEPAPTIRATGRESEVVQCVLSPV